MKKTVKRKRSNKFQLWLNDNEMIKLDKESKSVNMNMSDYIRNVIINGKVIVKHINFINCYELINQFTRIGTNINQIARNVNLQGNVTKLDVDLLSEQVGILQSIFIDEILKFQTHNKPEQENQSEERSEIL